MLVVTYRVLCAGLVMARAASVLSGVVRSAGYGHAIRYPANTRADNGWVQYPWSLQFNVGVPVSAVRHRTWYSRQPENQRRSSHPVQSQSVSTARFSGNSLNSAMEGKSRLPHTDQEVMKPNGLYQITPVQQHSIKTVNHTPFQGYITIMKQDVPVEANNHIFARRSYRPKTEFNDIYSVESPYPTSEDNESSRVLPTYYLNQMPNVSTSPYSLPMEKIRRPNEAHWDATFPWQIGFTQDRSHSQRNRTSSVIAGRNVDVLYPNIDGQIANARHGLSFAADVEPIGKETLATNIDVSDSNGIRRQDIAKYGNEENYKIRPAHPSTVIQHVPRTVQSDFSVVKQECASCNQVSWIPTDGDSTIGRLSEHLDTSSNHSGFQEYTSTNSNQLYSTKKEHSEEVDNQSAVMYSGEIISREQNLSGDDFYIPPASSEGNRHFPISESYLRETVPQEQMSSVDDELYILPASLEGNHYFPNSESTLGESAPSDQISAENDTFYIFPASSEEDKLFTYPASAPREPIPPRLFPSENDDLYILSAFSEGVGYIPYPASTSQESIPEHASTAKNDLHVLPVFPEDFGYFSYPPANSGDSIPAEHNSTADDNLNILPAFSQEDSYFPYPASTSVQSIPPKQIPIIEDKLDVIEATSAVNIFSEPKATRPEAPFVLGSGDNENRVSKPWFVLSDELVEPDKGGFEDGLVTGSDSGEYRKGQAKRNIITAVGFDGSNINRIPRPQSALLDEKLRSFVDPASVALPDTRIIQSLNGNQEPMPTQDMKNLSKSESYNSPASSEAPSGITDIVNQTRSRRITSVGLFSGLSNPAISTSATIAEKMVHSSTTSPSTTDLYLEFESVTVV